MPVALSVGTIVTALATVSGLYGSHDRDRSGYLSIDEAVTLLNSAELRTSVHTLTNTTTPVHSKAEIEAYFKKADTDRSGSLSRTEFLALYLAITTERVKKDPLVRLLHARMHADGGSSRMGACMGMATCARLRTHALCSACPNGGLHILPLAPPTRVRHHDATHARPLGPLPGPHHLPSPWAPQPIATPPCSAPCYVLLLPPPAFSHTAACRGPAGIPRCGPQRQAGGQGAQGAPWRGVGVLFTFWSGGGGVGGRGLGCGDGRAPVRKQHAAHVHGYTSCARAISEHVAWAGSMLTMRGGRVPSLIPLPVTRVQVLMTILGMPATLLLPIPSFVAVDYRSFLEAIRRSGTAGPGGPRPGSAKKK